jgi:hypothetical protein
MIANCFPWLITNESSLRRDALERLAALSASSTTQETQKDIARLCRRCPGPRSRLTASDRSSSTSRIPMVGEGRCIHGRIANSL